jgi:hypothetical protein
MLRSSRRVKMSVRSFEAKIWPKALEGRNLKLGDSHPHAFEPLKNLISIFEAWKMPEKAKEW